MGRGGTFGDKQASGRAGQGRALLPIPDLIEKMILSKPLEMELELEFRGAGTAAGAAGQRLLKAEVPRKNEQQQEVAVTKGKGQAGSLLCWFTTLVLYMAFLGLGLSIGILGPTFQDLATNVNRNISSLSSIFVSRASGLLCGSMISGVLQDHMNPFILLGISMLVITISLYITPFCKSAVFLIGIMPVLGASVGALDTGGNVLILALWGDKSPPHMQALHFSFALGAFLAPLLAKLALGPSGSADNHTEPGLLPPALNRSSEAASVSLLGFPHDMNLLWAYASTGTYILLVSLFFFALFFMKSSRQGKSTVSAQVLRRAKHHKALLCLLFMFFFFYVGAEVTYGSYIFSFATSHVGMDEREAAGLNSIFWGTFAACRGLAIFFAACLRPATMIVLSNVGSLASCLFLVLFDKSPLCLWIASSVYGASMATTFPSGVSWIEQYTTINSKSAAFFVIGASLGDMVIPAVMGSLQGQFPDLPLLMYSSLGSAIVTALLFPVMYKLATWPQNHQRKMKQKEQRPESFATTCGQ